MNVLITGKNGYVAQKLNEYLTKRGISSTTVSVRNGINEADMQNTDAVVHCAAIVHRKEKDISIYKKVNTDLTVDLAKKAKAHNVKNFIFLSSMAVYNSNGEINSKTPLTPKTEYGKSKLEAEKELLNLACYDFTVTIIRPPMVYGKGCKGNYVTLIKLAKLLPVLPLVKNKHSFISIDNLCEHIFDHINDRTTSVTHPMDEKYMSTTDLMLTAVNKPTSIVLGKLISLFMFIPKVKKAFGSLFYSAEIADFVISDKAD